MKMRTYIKAFEMKIVPKGNLYHSILTLEIRSVKSITNFRFPKKKNTHTQKIRTKEAKSKHKEGNSECKSRNNQVENKKI